MSHVVFGLRTIDMKSRPISPHLSVYRLAYTFVTSGIHRITGLVLSLGLVALAGWFMAAARGPRAFAAANDLLGSWPGKLVLGGFLAAFCYHLCNGIRHLAWDFGHHGFERADARRSAWIMAATALVIFLVLGWLAFFARSGMAP